MTQRGYTIGEFARQLGMSPDTLKYYEKLGIVSFRRNEESGYRYCDFQQCEEVFFARGRVTGQLGLRKEFGRHPAKECFLNSIEKIESEFKRRIALDKAGLLKTQELRNVYKLLNESKPSAEQGRSVRISAWFLPFARNESFLPRSKEELECFGKWRECFPVVGYMVPPPLTDENQGDVVHGVMAADSFVEEMGLSTEFATRVEGEATVYYFKHVTPNGLSETNPASARRKIVEHCRETIRKSGLRASSVYLEDLYALYQADMTARYVKAIYMNASWRIIERIRWHPAESIASRLGETRISIAISRHDRDANAAEDR